MNITLPSDTAQSFSFEKRFEAVCSTPLILDLAEKSLFMKRQFKKISPFTFVAGLSCGALGTSSSLNTIAETMAAFTGKLISKQAVAKRISQYAVEFLKLVLKAVVAYPLKIDIQQLDQILLHFKHVWLADSTSIKLDPSLVDIFPGSRNQTQKQSAILKIQLCYDILSGTLGGISTSAYTRNDQKASHDIFAIAQAGDLVIRDLGYLTMTSLQKMIEIGIFFVSRLSSQVAIFDLNGNPIDLLKHLKKHLTMDCDVLVSAAYKIKMRIVAIPLDKEITHRRIQKAKADRSSKTNHSDQYYELLGWSIYITNVPAEIIPANLIFSIYSIRWKIEIIFKVWKSYFRIAQIQKGSVHYVQSLIYAKLIMIILINHTYIAINNAVFKKTKRAISPLKLAQFISQTISPLTLTIRIFKWKFTFLEFISYYHSYEKRKKRRNMPELIAAIRPI